MNTAIQCVILLACTTICSSWTIIRCLCVKTQNAVNPYLVADIKEYNPRPYCNKKEVIVTLKDNSLRCLDPNGRFTQILLERKRMQRASRAAKMNTNPKTTTAPASAPATAPASAPASAPVTVTPTNIILQIA